MNRPAALIDFENIVFGARSHNSHYDPAIAAHRIAQVRQVTDAMMTTVAIQAALVPHYLDILNTAPWRVLTVDSGPDAADEALLAAAQDYLAHGVTDLVIASGDHRFADLATRTRLHVVSLRGATSSALMLAATDVLYLRAYPGPDPDGSPDEPRTGLHATCLAQSLRPVLSTRRRRRPHRKAG